MIERIKELLISEGLTSGAFADAIGVQRSSMSHILNGRNNPSLDFIIKTLQAFPSLNPEWLLLGIGPMKRETNAKIAQPLTREPSIFDSLPIDAGSVGNKGVIDEKNVDHKPAQTPEIETVNKEKEEIFVNKIVVFYNDHTYDVYYPNHNEKRF